MFSRFLSMLLDREIDERNLKPRYSAARVEDSPDTYDPQVVYLVGSKKQLWHAEMICPCGCNAVLKMNLQNDMRPCWRASIRSDKTVTLFPSVRRKVGCGSHFILRNGIVHWCSDEYDDSERG